MSPLLDVAIVGAGPFGLSAASHLRAYGIEHRIFGQPMDLWTNHMPQGMFLKSAGYASLIADPYAAFSFGNYAAGTGIPYDDTEIPVARSSFVAYGHAFCARFVPQVERKILSRLNRTNGHYSLCFDDGELVNARRVILAVGVMPFAHIPPEIAHLPRELLSHSSAWGPIDRLKGRKVIILGRGASAIDLAAEVHEAGISVHLLARSNLDFYVPPRPNRNILKRIRLPLSELGPGWRHKLYHDFPQAFFYLPERLRLHLLRSVLPPSGGYMMKDRVLGRVPMLLGRTVEWIEVRDDHLLLRARSKDGMRETFTADHVVAATGYKVDVGRLSFLGDEIKSNIRTTENMPILSHNFESSIPGLYFIGHASAYCFGPVARFVCGTPFTSRRLSRHLLKVLGGRSVPIPAAMMS